VSAPVAVATVTKPVKIKHDPGPNLIHNGDFEIGVDPGKFIWLNPGSQEIDSWQIVDGQIDYVGFAWSAASGERSIDLNGSPGKGSITQTINTEPGVHYEVTFYLAGNPMGNKSAADPIKYMRLELRAGNELTGRVFTFDTSAIDPSKIEWSKKQFSFHATEENTVLIFKSAGESNPWGPLIDNVAVHRLP